MGVWSECRVMGLEVGCFPGCEVLSWGVWAWV